MRRRPAVLAAAAVLATALAGPATAGAANRCDTLADRGKVLAKSSSTVVYSTGSRDDLDLYVHACQYKTRKPFRLPGQDGGDTERLETFRLAGRYLAWVSVNAEPAGNQVQSAIRVVDLKTRRQVVVQYSGLAPESDSSTQVTALALNTRGAAAWITRGTGEVTDNSVHTAAPGGEPAVLDRGADVALRSLGMSADGKLVYWTRGGQVKSSAAPGR